MKNFSFLIPLSISLFVFFSIKFFLFDLVKVNSNDMRNTYFLGDLVLIKKLNSSLKKNDVIYFNYPLKDSLQKNYFFIQRIVAAAGDTFQIINKQIFINNILQIDSMAMKFNYFFQTKNKLLDSTFKNKYQLVEGGEISDTYDYSYSLTKSLAERLIKDSLIKKIELKTEKANNFDDNCFPSSTNFLWNNDYYGKLYIPKKNDTLKLDTINIVLYKTLITMFEKNKLEIKSDTILINNLATKTYCVKQNYFFTMGDNRDNANDSREWGFVPENYIKGKVIAILKKAKR